ncbi:LPXTG-motif cell wall anchor domain-containing protein [Pilibacter termitis]|uniref:LPXTG-motif cell wall anchor domain-containing protein n=1 Tax=Pilibacter termitis TaxID=263852 RepID=A0A1T4LQL6_9ENTE|nr:LPXTG cell wall anchor domain-containing protein [Pilibacter termitis]SJZ57020.1 LPXTG-motif cell wall anchor domain-containing protein [Pilibacter termitis]
MLEASSEIVAEIPLDVTKEIMLHLPNKNGEEENVSQEKAIYYNKQRGNLPNTNGVEQKVSRNLLPSTNEIMRIGWCLVGTVLVGVFFLVRRKKKREGDYI